MCSQSEGRGAAFTSNGGGWFSRADAYALATRITQSTSKPVASSREVMFDVRTCRTEAMMLTRPETKIDDSDADAHHVSLVAQLAVGDRTALHSLYVALGPKCLAIGQRILGNRQEAEEILHDVFLEIWRRAKEYDTQRGEVGGWICTIMRSRAIDRLRHRKLHAGQQVEAQTQSSASVTPFDEASTHESQRSVAALLTQIPDEQRTIVELAYFEDLSQAEIAEKTGLPLGTVKTRIRLAMQKLVTLTRQMRMGGVR